MNKVGEKIESAREKVADKAEKFLPRTCNILKNPASDGGAAGDTLTPTPGPSGISYKYKSAGPRAEVVVGGEARSISHWLTFPFIEDTLAIKQEDKIQDEDDSQIIFQEPIVVTDSMSIFVKVAATLVQQGYN